MKPIHSADCYGCDERYTFGCCICNLHKAPCQFITQHRLRDCIHQDICSECFASIEVFTFIRRDGDINVINISRINMFIENEIQKEPDMILTVDYVRLKNNSFDTKANEF